MTYCSNINRKIEPENHFKNGKNPIKRAKLLFFAILLSGVSTFAQDIITLRNGDEIRAKVTGVSPSELRYKRFDNLDGPTIVIPRADVFFINYENGTREVIYPEPLVSRVLTVSEMPTEKMSIEMSTEQTATEIPTEQSVSEMPTDQLPVVAIEKPHKEIPPHSKFFVGLVGGMGGDIGNNKYSDYLLGINVAYFFNHFIGVGFAAHNNFGYIRWNLLNIDLYATKVRMTFFGPAFYGNWGFRTGALHKLSLTTCISLGAYSYIYDCSTSYINYSDDNKSSLGVMLSGGLAYRPTSLISIGLNYEFGDSFPRFLSQHRASNYFYYNFFFASALNFHF